MCATSVSYNLKNSYLEVKIDALLSKSVQWTIMTAHFMQIFASTDYSFFCHALLAAALASAEKGT